MRFKRVIQSIVFILTIFIATISSAADLPRPSSAIGDYAGVLPAATKARLESMLSSFERQTDIAIVVATVQSLNDIPIEEFATSLYASWGIGKRGKDEGALFLIAPSDRKVRIEVGYGLEDSLNDAATGRILDSEFLPRFKAGRVGEGIAAGALAIVQTVATRRGIDFNVEQSLGSSPAMGSSPARSKGSVILKLIGFIIIAILFIRYPRLFLLLLLMTGRGGGGSGNGFGGGFGGFGGGLSGGGGSSRSW